jgi:hypothetical protein
VHQQRLERVRDALAQHVPRGAHVIRGGARF